MISGKTTLIAHHRLSDGGLQGADDLQPVLRAGGNRRGCHAHGGQARGLRRVPAPAVSTYQHPRRAGNDAAQGHDGGDGRRGHADGLDCRLLQCDPQAPRRFAAGRHVRRHRVRPRHRAQGCNRSRARVRWSSAPAAWARRSPHRSQRPEYPRSAYSMPMRIRPRRSAARLRQHYPTLAVTTGSKDPAGYDVVVNATPLGMKAGDPLPMDVSRASRRRRSSARSS